MSALIEQIRQIDARIQKIRTSGEIAPESVWISSFRAGSARKHGYKYYTYFKLMEWVSGKRGQRKREKAYLGKETSTKYQWWQEAIQRREQIGQLLQKRQELLLELARSQEPI